MRSFDRKFRNIFKVADISMGGLNPLGHRDKASNYSTYVHLKMLVTRNG